MKRLIRALMLVILVVPLSGCLDELEDIYVEIVDFVEDDYWYDYDDELYIIIGDDDDRCDDCCDWFWECW